MITALALSAALVLTGAPHERYNEAELRTDGLWHRVMLTAEGSTLTCVEFEVGGSPWGKTVKVWQGKTLIAHWKLKRGRTGCLGIDRKIKAKGQKFKVQVREDYPGPWNPTDTKTVTLW